MKSTISSATERLCNGSWARYPAKKDRDIVNAPNDWIAEQHDKDCNPRPNALGELIVIL